MGARTLELVLDAAGKKGRVGIARAIEEFCASPAVMPEVLELLTKRASSYDSWLKSVKWIEAIINLIRNKKIGSHRYPSLDQLLDILVTESATQHLKRGFLISSKEL